MYRPVDSVSGGNPTFQLGMMGTVSFETAIRFIRFLPRRIPRKIGNAIFHMRHGRPNAPDGFDARTGLDTAANLPVYKLDAVSRNYIHSMGYQPLPEDVFRALIAEVPVDPREFTFVDLGCGKGKPLFLASEMGFKKIIGIELSPTLAAIATQNLAKWNRPSPPITILCCDVVAFRWPKEPLVVFMHNPFGRAVMAQVMESLHAAWPADSMRVWIAYYSPALAPYMQSLPWLSPCPSQTGKIYRCVQ